jgi:hypothetical protein
MFEDIGYDFGDICIGDHTDLDRIDTNIIKQSCDLCGYEICWQQLYPAHALGILYRQSSDSGHPIDAMGRKGLEVSLYASPT